MNVRAHMHWTYLVYLISLFPAEFVELFFIDTSPFVDDYFINPEHIYDWNGVSPREFYLAKLLKVTNHYFQLHSQKSLTKSDVDINLQEINSTLQ